MAPTSPETPRATKRSASRVAAAKKTTGSTKKTAGTAKKTTGAKAASAKKKTTRVTASAETEAPASQASAASTSSKETDDLWDADWGDLGEPFSEPAHTTSTDQGSGNEDVHRGTSPAAEGIERFQGAVREMITAARVMLDLAEDLVEDPRALRTVFSSVADSTNDFFRMATGAAPSWVRPEPEPEPEPEPMRDDDGIQRIRID